MNIIRAIFRSILVIFILLGMYLFFLLNLLTLKNSRLRRKTVILKIGCKMLCAALRIRVRTTGRRPKPPFILVCNHLSYIDILVLASQLESVFISKAEVRGWPFFGPLCALAGTIFIRRKDRSEVPRVNALIEEVYDSGNGILFFPEGTSTSGSDVKEFKSPLLESAVRREYPVHYASLNYATPKGSVPAGYSVCWWGEMEFAPHFQSLLQLPKIKAKIHFGSKPLTAKDRDVLARDLRAAVLEQFVPVQI